MYHHIPMHMAMQSNEYPQLIKNIRINLMQNYNVKKKWLLIYVNRLTPKYDICYSSIRYSVKASNTYSWEANPSIANVGIKVFRFGFYFIDVIFLEQLLKFFISSFSFWHRIIAMAIYTWSSSIRRSTSFSASLNC